MTQPSAQYAALYQSTIEDAATGGRAIMDKLVEAVRRSVQVRLQTARDLREREVHEESLRILYAQERVLAEQYPIALLSAFTKPSATAKAPTLTMAEVQFDQLELMDDAQVQESVSMARAQQMALLAAEVSLAELNTLICTTLGLPTVRPERNPLRPEVYLRALKDVVERAAVPANIRLDWIATMGVALGAELKELYVRLAGRMRAQGVVAAGYAVVPTPGGGTASGQRAGSAAGPAGYGAPGSAEREAMIAAEVRTQKAADPALLTLDRLRKLLAGELDQHQPAPRVAAFAQQFARQFEGEDMLGKAPEASFDATIPAALEALTEMKQVGRVVERLEQRRMAPQTVGDGSADRLACDAIRRSATGVAQALSLEVVNLMVDNIARDPRLLAPVQQLVRQLEPALMRLALVDPRLFTDKQHVARLLVQELTHRSLAFANERSPGFVRFLDEVREALEPLASFDLQGPEPFEVVLRQLQSSWSEMARQQENSRAHAVQALQNAEQRNLLAEKIARDIDSHPDAAKVPEVVIAFLCGPWAQVVAQARLQGGAGSAEADKYQALISALLWSTHPDLARSNLAKLTRLVPRLISTLREGLETIRYPATKTSVFLEALMGLHQQIFRSAPARADEPLPTIVDVPHVPVRPVENGDPWVAPGEAGDSNFIELPSLSDDRSATVAQAASETSAAATVPTSLVGPESALAGAGGLPLGAWVELSVNSEWVRTQLTWASPHGTLFLFTSAMGTTQSMTRRTHDKLVAAGQLRVISGQAVVDEALDAVAQQAMRNSVDSTL
ncbi:MAG: DUF1631 family protein [Rhodoferax sp.]|nr:DUF1631 family protein [Rhodoferax sp.]